jgi:two-component system, cell cycle sensor histidine kinase and response regulator CckA
MDVLSFLEQWPVATVCADRSGAVAGWNVAAERLLGWSASEMAGAPLPEARPPGAGLASLHALVVPGAPPRSARLVLAAKDGRDVAVSALAFPLEVEGRPPLVAFHLAPAPSAADAGPGAAAPAAPQPGGSPQLQEILEALPVPIFFKDAAGIYRGCNAAFERYLGRPRDGILGKSVDDIAAPDLARTYRAADEALLASRAPQFYEARVQWGDGTLREVLFSKGVIVDGEGRVAGLAGTILDITERKREEQAARDNLAALRRTEGLLRAITDSIPDPIFVKDRESRWLFSNPATLQVTGKARLEEVLGRTDTELFTDAGLAAALMEADRRVVLSGAAEVLEENVDTPGGRRVYLATKVPYRDEDGRIIGIIGTARDITDRKRAEELLRQSEARFRALIEKSIDMISVLDAEGRVRFWSPSASEGLGWSAQEMMGRAVAEHIHADDVAQGVNALRAIHDRPGTVSQARIRFRHRDGSWRLVEARARNLLHDPAVEGIVVNSRDVTEQRRLEEQFHEAQKMESIGRLAGGVAHDFNNLLTVVLSCSDALLDDLPPASPAREDAQEIRAAAQRARDLTRQLLAFARRQDTAPIPLDLGEVVRGAERLVRRLVGSDVHLVTSLQPDPWSVRCDPGQVEQVLLNLAANARDAMPGGGTLTVEVANAMVAEGDASARPGLRPGSHVRLAVRDTGTGMSPDVKRHMFEPFFTTKPQGKGTGLGLATVYGIVEQNGGFILVDSEPGRGTTFELYFPRVAAGARAVADAA